MNGLHQTVLCSDCGISWILGFSGHTCPGCGSGSYSYTVGTSTAEKHDPPSIEMPSKFLLCSSCAQKDQLISQQSILIARQDHLLTRAGDLADKQDASIDKLMEREKGRADE